jgi:hypothetical protein
MSAFLGEEARGTARSRSSAHAVNAERSGPRETGKGGAAAWRDRRGAWYGRRAEDAVGRAAQSAVSLGRAIVRCWRRGAELEVGDGPVRWDPLLSGEGVGPDWQTDREGGRGALVAGPRALGLAATGLRKWRWAWSRPAG